MSRSLPSTRRHVLSTVAMLVQICWFSAPALAGDVNLHFTHFGKDDGLNQSSVNCLLQDRRGMVWIGTFGGINRFDGYSFRSYTKDANDPTTIPDSTVWTIFEDSQQRLWFGSKAGLSLYRRSTDSFRNYYIGGRERVGMLAVKAILETSDGRLLVGSEGQGLFSFDPETEEFTAIAAEVLGRTRVSTDSGESLIAKGRKINALAQGLDGRLWIGTEERGLFSLDARTGAVTAHTTADASPQLKSAGIWALLVDEQGSLWVGTDREGLFRLDRGREAFIRYLQAPATPSPAQGPAAHERTALHGYRSGVKIKALAEDSHGAIWIGSATESLARYDRSTGRFQTWVANEVDTSAPHDKDVSVIVPGHNGVLYVGYYMKGFDKAIVTPFHSIRHRPEALDPPDRGAGLTHNTVYAMHRDQHGKLWFGTFGGGLNIYDPKAHTFEVFRHDPDDPTTISHDFVRYIYQRPSRSPDTEGEWWIGTWGGGVNRFDRARGTFTRYVHDPDNPRSLGLNIVTTIFEDSDGTLWLGTYGAGLDIHEPETDGFAHIRHDPSDPNSLSDDHITAIYEWQPGVLWICTYGGGINRYDLRRRTFERFLSDLDNPAGLHENKILHMYPEPGADFFWVTSLGGGLIKFYPESQRFHHYTTQDGLSDNTTMGLLRSADGHLWMGTNTGLSRLDARAERFTNYRVYDGLSSDDFNLEAYAQTEDGRMWLGGKRGVIHFDPAEVTPRTDFPRVEFTRITVDEQPVPDIDTPRLHVPYQSPVTFEFAALNPERTRRIRYEYQLRGFEDRWRDMGARRSLEFRALPPGNYELRVRSTNSSGRWNPNFVSAHFHIPTPWYQTWLFRVSVVVFLLLVAFAYYRRRVRVLEAQRQTLEKTVAERTQTIAEKNESLELALADVRKLEAFKDAMTGMVVHDLKNPLASILGFSRVEPTRANMERIHRSGRNMLDLVENILDIQKFENTAVELDAQTFDLAATVERTLQALAVTAEPRRVVLESRIASGTGVHGDESLVERILANLVSNAIKFSPLGEVVTVAASTAEHERPGDDPDDDPDDDQDDDQGDDRDDDRILVQVRDRGPGIPEHLRAVIFERFSQVEARQLGASRSTGLGLAFCRLAVTAHGGEIWVESSDGGGSTFSFTLPMRTLETGAAPTPGPRAQANAEATAEATIDEETTSASADLALDDDDRQAMAANVASAASLSLYETGDWFAILEVAEASGRVRLATWAHRMRDALAQFDEQGFEDLKCSLVGDDSTGTLP